MKWDSPKEMYSPVVLNYGLEGFHQYFIGLVQQSIDKNKCIMFGRLWGVRPRTKQDLTMSDFKGVIKDVEGMSYDLLKVA